MIFKLKTKEQLIKDGCYVDSDGCCWIDEDEETERFSKPDYEIERFFRAVEKYDDVFGKAITNSLSEASKSNLSIRYLSNYSDAEFKFIYEWASEHKITYISHPEYFL
jgi:hypothetical protein